MSRTDAPAEPPADTPPIDRRWAWRVVVCGLGLAVGTICTAAPDMLRGWFPSITPTGAFAGVVGLGMLLGLLVLPAVVARHVHARGTRLPAALGEALLWFALLAPGVVAGWKHAPHAAEALPALALLLALVLLAGATWGWSDGRCGGRLSRWLVLGVAGALALPAIGLALWEYAGREPWWLMVGNPVWFAADTAPPRPSVSGSPFFAPTAWAWLAIALTGLLPGALALRRWRSGGLVLLLTATAGVLGVLALFAPLSPRMPPPGLTAATGPELPHTAVPLAARWAYGPWGGDGFLLPARLVADTAGSPADRVTVRSGLTAVHAPLPRADGGIDTVAPALLLPGSSRLLIDAGSGHGSPAAVGELAPPAFPFARGSVASNRSGGYLAAVLEGPSPIGARLSDAEGREQALVPLKGHDVPGELAPLMPFSAIVLATADLAEVAPPAREALAMRVRAGALLVFTGFPRSGSLWRDLLDRLGLREPRARGAGSQWRNAAADVVPDTSMGTGPGASWRVQWQSADVGAGTVARLHLPREASEATNADLLRQWLSGLLGNARDPIGTYAIESGGRLLSGRLFTDALAGNDPMGPVPPGNLPTAWFAWGLTALLTLAAVRWYGLTGPAAGASLAVPAIVLALALGVAMPARHLEVLEVPICVTRAAPGDNGHSREVRWVRATAAKDASGPVAVHVPADGDVVPAANDERELDRLPFDLYWPGVGEPRVATAGLGDLLAGQYRLLRVERPAPAPGLALHLMPGGQHELEVGPGTRLLALIHAEDFAVRPLASAAGAGRLQVPGSADAPADSFQPWRRVLHALRSGEHGAAVLADRERHAYAMVVGTAIRRGQHFLAAVIDQPTGTIVAADGVSEALRPILLLPITRLPDTPAFRPVTPDPQ